MADREKVIKGLEQCLAVSKKRIRLCSDCPYCEYDSKDDMDCWDWLATHALALLKEQEAVKPKSKARHGKTCQYQHWCGNCMVMLHGKPKYCPNCGRSVKWE